MTWLLIIVLALACAGIGFWLFRLTGQAALVLAAVLAVGLALYALQGRPDLPGSPAEARAPNTQGASALVDMRQRVMGSKDGFRARHLLTGDAFARRGQYAQAVAFLRGAVRDNPQDTEAWVALGNALVEHSGGRLTPPAILAYRRAREADPASLAPDFFIGIALIGQGRLGEAQALWRDALTRVPEDADYREEFAGSLARLEQLIERVAEMQNAGQQ